MIRIEIEIEERKPGKVDMLCRSFTSNREEITDGEMRVADRLCDNLWHTCADVAGMFGSVERFEGEGIRGVRL